MIRQFASYRNLRNANIEITRLRAEIDLLMVENGALRRRLVSYEPARELTKPAKLPEVTGTT